MNKIFKIIIWPVLFIALAFLYLNYSHTHQNDHSDHKEVNQTTADTRAQKSTQKPHTSAHNHQNHKTGDSHTHADHTAKQKQIITEIRSFSYKEETERVNKMTANYPESREEIIEFVSKNDPYKEASIAVEPHTVDSIKQNQIGALKVLALKNVHLKEQSNQSRIKFYEDLLSKAKDPTIVKILQASIESAKQGRDFSKDFLDGVENQPLEDSN